MISLQLLACDQYQLIANIGFMNKPNIWVLVVQ